MNSLAADMKSEGTLGLTLPAEHPDELGAGEGIGIERYGGCYLQ